MAFFWRISAFSSRQNIWHLKKLLTFLSVTDRYKAWEICFYNNFFDMAFRLKKDLKNFYLWFFKTFILACQWQSNWNHAMRVYLLNIMVDFIYIHWPYWPCTFFDNPFIWILIYTNCFCYLHSQRSNHHFFQSFKYANQNNASAQRAKIIFIRFSTNPLVYILAILQFVFCQNPFFKQHYFKTSQGQYINK